MSRHDPPRPERVFARKREDAAGPCGAVGAYFAGYAAFFRILAPYFWPRGVVNKALALSCFALLGASKAAGVIAPLYLTAATDALIGRADLTRASINIIVFAALRLAVALFEEGQRLVYLRVKEAAYRDVATRAFEHVHALSLHWHISKRSGVVLRAMDRGIGAANTVVEMLFLRMIPSVAEAAALAAIFATNYKSPDAAGVLVGTFIAYFGVTFGITEYRSHLRASSNRADNEAAAIANDCLTGFETVKAFGNEGYELARYDRAIRAFQRASRGAQSTLVLLNVSQAAITRAALLGVMLVAARDVANGRSTIGDFVGIQAYVVQLFGPLSFLGTIYTMVQNATIDLQNLSDLLDERPDVADRPKAAELSVLDRTKGATVEFRHVSFTYPAASEDRIARRMAETERREAAPPARCCCRRVKPAVPVEPRAPGSATAVSVDAVAVDVEKRAPTAIISDLSFTIRAGTTTAIVGATGAGKSTLAKLLMRFYDVTDGCVLVDGQDVRTVSQASLRAHIGIVPQDTTLFNDTLRFNMKYGRPLATDDDMRAAAVAAQIAPFIESQKDGYNTKVGERGLRLSGGEKQRVAIARVLLKDPPILILDEATSSLDTLTEAQVQAALSTARQGRTVLCIAHRLSTIRDADEIIVLDGGRIAERGTHDALLAAQGLYSRLWQQQAADREAAQSVEPAAAAAEQTASSIAAPPASNVIA